jgi:hypothetical protein
VNIQKVNIQEKVDIQEGKMKILKKTILKKMNVQKVNIQEKGKFGGENSGKKKLILKMKKSRSLRGEMRALSELIPKKKRKITKTFSIKLLYLGGPEPRS